MRFVSKLHSEGTAWRIQLGQAIMQLLMPSMSLRRLRCAGLRLLAGFDFALGSEICGGTRFTGRHISVAHGSYIGPFCLFEINSQSNISIGSNVSIGPAVKFITSTHAIGTKARRAGDPQCAPITVGDGAWIGASSLILPGIRIGTGALVAAGSVVIHDVADGQMVGGNPARLLKTLPDA